MKDTVMTLKLDLKTSKMVETVAKEENTSKSEIVRNAINYYVISRNTPRKTSLSKMVNNANKIKSKVPKDLSSNMNKYLYGI